MKLKANCGLSTVRKKRENLEAKTQVFQFGSLPNFPRVICFPLPQYLRPKWGSSEPLDPPPPPPHDPWNA